MHAHYATRTQPTSCVHCDRDIPAGEKFLRVTRVNYARADDPDHEISHACKDCGSTTPAK